MPKPGKRLMMRHAMVGVGVVNRNSGKCRSGALRAFGLGALLAVVLVAPASAQTLGEAVEIAIRTHPTVLAALASSRAADFGIREARAGFLPTLDLRAGGGYARSGNSTTRARPSRAPGSGQSDDFFRGESSIILQQMIYDAFETRNRVEGAAARAGAADFSVLAAGEVIGLRAVAAYLGVLRDRETLALADINVERHRDVVDKLQAGVDAGTNSMADLDQAKGRLALTEATRAQLTGRLRDSDTAYLEAVGDAPGNVSRPLMALDTMPGDMDMAVAAAVETNPQLSAAREAARASSFDAEAAEAPFQPRFALQVQGSRNENAGGTPGPNTDASALVVMTYNLYRGGADTARLGAAKARRVEAQQREYEARRTVEQTTRFAWSAYTVASERVPQLQDQVKLTDSALAAYYEQFQLGKRTLLDVLNGENEVFQARAALVDAEVALMIAQHQVLAATGRLLPTYQLSPTDSAVR